MAVAFVAVLFGLNGAAHADSSAKTQSAYTVAYAAEPETCQHFLKLFNDDIAKYGHIDPAAHEEFTSVHWKSLGEGPYGTVKDFLAILDLNNDGQPDYVVKHSASLGGILSDNLFVFRNEPQDSEDVGEALRARVKGDPRDVIAALRNGKSGNFYELRMLPQRTIGSGADQLKFYEVIGSVFAIFPMRYRNSTYISINDRTTGNLRLLDITHWQVIAKYRPDFQLDDVCYFKGPRDKELRR